MRRQTTLQSPALDPAVHKQAAADLLQSQQGCKPSPAQLAQLSKALQNKAWPGGDVASILQQWLKKGALLPKLDATQLYSCGCSRLTHCIQQGKQTMLQSLATRPTQHRSRRLHSEVRS